MTDCYVQSPMFDPPSAWAPTPVSQLPSWEGASRVSIDLETRDPDIGTLGPGVRRPGSYVVGVSIAISDGPSRYLPIRHALGDNLPEEHVWAYLRDQARAFKGEIVGANFGYDLDWLWEKGLDFSGVKRFRDVTIAEPLLNELEFTYGLDDVLARHSLPGKDETHLRHAASRWGLDPKAELWKLPARHVGAYAEADARLPLALLRRQEREIDSQGLWQIWDLESDVLPVLVRMRRRGIRLDLDRLARVEEWTWEREKDALERVRKLTGVEFELHEATRTSSVWEEKPIERAMLAIGVTLPRTAGRVSVNKNTGEPELKTKASTKAEVLEAIDHEAARAIVRARRVNKLRTTFAASLRRHMTNGRIHCTLNQLRFQKDEDDTGGAAYGRLSGSNPNLQQQPARDEELGPMFRGIYLPEEGRQWACLDYSSQEPRMTVHYAGVTGCAGADEMVARFVANPKTDLHQETADLCGLIGKKGRKDAKTIFLGRSYGMGGAKMCRRLGLPLLEGEELERKRDEVRRTWKHASRVDKMDFPGPEGKALIDRFDASVPFLKELAKRARDVALVRGHVWTILRRKCRFPQKRDGTYDYAHKALNRIIQGSSADQTKKALVELERAGCFLQLQVHDEIDCSVEGEAEARRYARVMEEVVQLSVPSVVDVELGPSWGEAK